MRAGWVWCTRRIRQNVGYTRRWLSSPVQSSKVPPVAVDLSRTRNIGIIAHIDAGKTTTTERMLYYSGYTRRIGDVDEGSTVTDFLPAERARGITIQSAAITFYWPPPSPYASTPPQQISTLMPRSSTVHNINLIDTPGHADFTFEVLRSLRVLDGAVCILDGVAGVEAQTEKVWTQAGHYQIPRIVYVNKLDRVGAAFSMTVKEIGLRLHGWPAVCQIPWWKDGKDQFVGVGDIVNLRGLLWKEASDGKDIKAIGIRELEDLDSNLAVEIRKARVALVELLSEHDDGIVELFLEHNEDHMAIPGSQITESLRRVVQQSPQQVIPVFAGASFRNIGVQPLLDAVVDLLPSPTERPDAEISLAGKNSTLGELLSGKAVALQQSTAVAPRQKKTTNASIALAENLQGCALAFKVVNDNKRGVLVYIRVYSGSIDRGSLLFNTNLNVTERAPRLLKMYASDAVEVDSVPAGQIGVITGLKFARTGDTLITYRGANPKSGPPVPINSLQLRPINVPPPVFFTSIEPNSLSEEKHVLDTLALLLREDPSLNLSVDEESGQNHLAGMGELHLEIARDRLLNDFKAKARTGRIEIGYRETLTTPSESVAEHLEREVAGKFAKASCIATVQPLDSPLSTEDLSDPFKSLFTVESNQLLINHPTLSKLSDSSNDPILPPHLSLSSILSSVQAGVSSALSRGPSNGFPIASTLITITIDPASHIFPETTSAALSIVSRQAVQTTLRRSHSSSPATLMEPVMLVTIFVNESSLGSVVQDISSARGGQVLSLDGDDPSPSSQSFDDLPTINPDQIYTPPDPFQGSPGGKVEHGGGNRQRQIVARVPLKEMVGYLNHLRSLTGGRGTFVMTVDGFEKMSGQRQKEVLEQMRGDYV